jgi:hypothetical protein
LTWPNDSTYRIVGSASPSLFEAQISYEGDCRPLCSLTFHNFMVHLTIETIYKYQPLT